MARLGRVEEAADRAIEMIESTGYSGSPQVLSSALPNVFTSLELDEQARQVAEVAVAALLQMEADPEYLAQALVTAGRYDEARQVLARVWDDLRLKGRACGFLAYMAAMEGDGEEATRLSEMAVTADDPEGVRRFSSGVMWQAVVAAHLGDPAGAVKYVREAFRMGYPYGPGLLRNYDLTPLYGYQPFEDLMQPKG